MAPLLPPQSSNLRLPCAQTSRAPAVAKPVWPTAGAGLASGGEEGIFADISEGGPLSQSPTAEEQCTFLTPSHSAEVGAEAWQSLRCKQNKILKPKPPLGQGCRPSACSTSSVAGNRGEGHVATIEASRVGTGEERCAKELKALWMSSVHASLAGAKDRAVRFQEPRGTTSVPTAVHKRALDEGPEPTVGNEERESVEGLRVSLLGCRLGSLAKDGTVPN